MKIIHTADIHLDSPLVGVADSALRRTELLRALSDLSEFADNSGVAAVIVAGDLFDDQFVSEKTVKSVAEIVEKSNAQWFVLRGNHGSETPYKALKTLCPKVNFFGESWQEYRLGNVSLIGRELGRNDESEWQKFSVDPSRYNVLVLHGDWDDPTYGVIDKDVVAKSGVNYVALGHRHSFACFKTGNAKVCYSGVLEPRGFDETSETGFVVIDTDADKVFFQKHYVRKVETVTVDVSEVCTDLSLEKLVLEKVAPVSARNYLNVEFVGSLQEGVRLLPVAQNVLENRFFALRLKDKTVLKVDYEQIKQEVSLRGEFVKLACEIADEKLREEVLSLGLRALNGEV